MSYVQSHENQFKSPTAVKPAPKKGVFWLILVIVCLILVLGAVSAFRYFDLFANDSTVPMGVIFEEVKRGVFLHEVTDRGNVESAQNEDIRCRVESPQGTLIVWIIPEGTVVEEGEVICRLDSSNLDERVANQEITVTNSSASLAQAVADLKIAELALDEYEEGTYKKELKIIENRILKAEEDLSRAAETRGYTEKLLAQGYVTELQLKADKAREEQLQNDLEVARLEMKVLEDYTSAKMLEQLNSAIVTARAKEDSARRRYEIDDTRLNYLKTQVGYCTIHATKAGQVVYATPNNPWRRDMDLIKEGMTVRDRQVIIRLPDPNQMQVSGMVNESRVSLVKVGQPVSITLEAMPSHVFSGTVKQVNDYPEPDSFMGSMAKEYKTVISMDDLDSLPSNLRSGIRPGLSAQIKIDVTDPSLEELPILVPVQTLFEHAGKYYCITCDAGHWEKVEVEVGPTNDKEVVIRSGLTEGMRVVQGAWRYIDRVLTEEERTSARQFGIGGARQRRGPGGPGGPNGQGGPSAPPPGDLGSSGGPEGARRGPGADFTPPSGGPGGIPNADRNSDTVPTNGGTQPGALRPDNEMRDTDRPAADTERPGNGGMENNRRENPDSRPPGGNVTGGFPENRSPPAGGDFRPHRPSGSSGNSPPLSSPTGGNATVN